MEDPIIQILNIIIYCKNLIKWLYIIISKMQAKTFSKAYLQSMPILRKLEFINSFIDDTIRNIENAAAIGKTSYLINIYIPYSLSKPHNITNDEFIVIFKERFPDCKVSFLENQGIKIDWS